ncbi:MAG: M1 family peptidase, partial [Planctomycetota bacterium]
QDVEQGRIFEYAQWFPCVCVYDDVYGWNTLNYLGSGEFYTNYGDYEVNLTLPREYVATATGVLQNPAEVLTATQRQRLQTARESDEPVAIIAEDEVGTAAARPPGTGPLTWRFKAENVRTFAWAACDAFRWDACAATITDLSGAQRKVLCQAFYPREAKAWAAEHDKGGAARAVKHAIEFYSEFVYPYPYPQMSNVNGPEGGMEYPMIVFCGSRKNARGMFGVTDHEVGHNWFPMLVNTDERRHVWMDEGFNSFINVYSRSDYYEKKQLGRASADVVVGNMLRPDQQPIVTHPDQMLGGRVGFLGYRKVAAGLVALREHVLGPERFDRAFKTYVRRWAFKSPRPADFFRTIEDVAGEDLAWFWRGWFQSTGTLDQSIVTVRQDRESKTATIVLANRGRLVMPVALEIKYDDGQTERRRVPVEAWYSSNRIEHRLPTQGRRIVAVRIDPDELLPDVERRNNVWGRW